ncbi:MAG: FlgD immunoglobulin-like domain containing protein [Candidatus Krumholzibacteriia bacterium]
MGLPAPVRDAAWLPPYAVTVHDAGLAVIDLADPGTPVQIGALPRDMPRGIALIGSLAVVVGLDSLLQVVDLTLPATPAVLATLPLPGPGLDVEIEDGLACVASDTLGVIVVDLGDPAAPALLATLPTPYHARDLALQDGYAYVADTHGLVVLDLGDFGASATGITGRPDPYMLCVAVHGDYAYLLDETFGLQVFDVSRPLDPVYAGAVSTSGSGGLAVQGDLLLAGSGPGLEFYALDTPAAPTCVGRVNSAGVSVDLCAAGPVVLLALPDQHSLDLIDADPLVEASPIGTLTLPGWCVHVAVSPPRAYLSCRWAGLVLVDVSRPEKPLLAGAVPALGHAHQTAIEGNLAYVAAEDDGLQIVDITEPDATIVIGSAPTPGSAQSLALDGGRAYVVDGDGLRILDVSAPAAPLLLGGLEVDGYATGVAVADGRVLVGTGNALLVVDVDDPAAPIVLGQTSAWARAVAWRDGLAYTSSSPGLQVFAVDLDGAPAFVDSLPLPGYGNHIALGDGCAYLSNHSGGLQVVDLADPTHPRLLGSSTAYASAADIEADILWVAAVNRLYSYPIQCEVTAAPEATSPPRLSLWAQPNPCNPTATLGYRLPTPGPMRLSVHDVRGRRLRTLAEGWQPGGERTATWDGRDARGRALPSGVYLARLEAAGRVESLRVVLLR